MDEEILEYLIKVGATSRETGRTLKELMNATERNIDTVVTHTRHLLCDRKVQVSNSAMLMRNPRNVWPSPSPGKIEVTDDEVARTRHEWREQNFFPIVAWLGPVILQELDEKRRMDEMQAHRREVIARPQYIGNLFLGDATHVNTGPVVQGALSASNLATSSVQNRSTNAGNTSKWLSKNTAIMLVVGVFGGLLVLILWELIRLYI